MMYRSGPEQGIKQFYPRVPVKQHNRIRSSNKFVYATNDPSYAAAFCFQWSNTEGFTLGRSKKTDPWVFGIPEDKKHLLNNPCSMYILDDKNFKKLETSTPEFYSNNIVPVLTEIKYPNCKALLKAYNIRVVFLKTPIIFFLPLETRPKNLPQIQMTGQFWHTGIIRDGKVYETFNYGKYSITSESKRLPELKNQKAVFIKYSNMDDNVMNSEITSGTSCGTYVARVIGLSDSTGDEKTHYPDDVYKFIKQTYVSEMFINEFVVHGLGHSKEKLLQQKENLEYQIPRIINDPMRKQRKTQMLQHINKLLSQM